VFKGLCQLISHQRQWISASIILAILVRSESPTHEFMHQNNAISLFGHVKLLCIYSFDSWHAICIIKNTYGNINAKSFIFLMT